MANGENGQVVSVPVPTSWITRVVILLVYTILAMAGGAGILDSQTGEFDENQKRQIKNMAGEHVHHIIESERQYLADALKRAADRGDKNEKTLQTLLIQIARIQERLGMEPVKPEL